MPESEGARADWRPVCTTAELADGGLREVALGEHPVVVGLNGDRPFAAYGLCPHERAPLAGGTIAGGRLHCPRHKASFDLHDGTPDPGWRIAALPLLPVRCVAGRVEIDAHALDRLPGIGRKRLQL